METKTITSIIIGDGTVGKALGKAMNITPLGISDEKVSAEVVIICVPTPTLNGQQDISAVNQALSRVEGAELVILRSTVLPGTTERLQATFPYPLLFVPEWGFEKTMEDDLANPTYHVFGFTERSSTLLYLAVKILPKAADYRYMPATAAEFSKYFANIWGSSQVVLANSFYDWVMNQTNDPSIYDQAIEATKLHKNIPTWGWKIFDQGHRGYDGKCLPKDTQAAISQYPNPLWTQIEDYNNRLKERPK